jgi:hypothetical protein
VACSTTVKQYRGVSVIVSTLKKSQAKIPEALALRNCVQVRSPRWVLDEPGLHPRA